ncbi:MAG TPA: glycosyltransferase family 4 protein [Vicinamibacteria bacterium]|nr:glycosyltransferase family 4 protein [Vicinamibacteria bacterium]
MRILHLSDRLSERGGAYQHLLGVLEAQVAQEHHVTLAAGRADEGVAAPCDVLTVPELDARTSVEVDLDPLVDALAPDVMHLHTVVNPAALRWAGRHGAVMTVQDHRYFCPGRGKWTLAGEICRVAPSLEACAACFEDASYFEEIQGLTRERLEALKELRVVVLSRYMRDELVAAGLDGARVTVVPPFVRGLSHVAAEGPDCVLFVGRLVAGKGPLEAAHAWHESGVDLPLVVAGAGPLRPDLERLGARVVGWVGRAGLAVLLARARVLVMASRWQEPFGIAGLEALASGVPVAAWDSGGVRDWHPGDGLAPWGDVPALAQAIRALVGRRAAAPAGFERERLMARLHDVYAGAAPSRQARAS